MFFTTSAAHRLSADRLMTVESLKTPFSVPTRCSPLLMMKPIQHPDSQRSSKAPTLDAVLGILKRTDSPNGTSLELDRRPFMSWKAVLPSARTLDTLIKCAACRTNHGTMGSSNFTRSPVLDSRSERKVLTRPLRS